MPDPKSIFTALKADLEAVGIKVNAVSKPWNGGYLDDVAAARQARTCTSSAGPVTTTTPDNFIGTSSPGRQPSSAPGHDRRHASPP